MLFQLAHCHIASSTHCPPTVPPLHPTALICHSHRVSSTHPVDSSTACAAHHRITSSPLQLTSLCAFAPSSLCHLHCTAVAAVVCALTPCTHHFGSSAPIFLTDIPHAHGSDSYQSARVVSAHLQCPPNMQYHLCTVHSQHLSCHQASPVQSRTHISTSSSHLLQRPIALQSTRHLHLCLHHGHIHCSSIPADSRASSTSSSAPSQCRYTFPAVLSLVLRDYVSSQLVAPAAHTTNATTASNLCTALHSRCCMHTTAVCVCIAARCSSRLRLASILLVALTSLFTSLSHVITAAA